MRRTLVVAPFLAFLIFTLPQLRAADHLQPFIHDMQPLRGARQVLTLRRAADRIEIRDDGGSVLASHPFDATSSVIVNGSNGDDTLVVDFTNGNPIPGGLEFNGGAEATREGDLIAIQGGSFEKVVVDYINRSDGAISLDGTVIKYTGLEPIDMSGITVSDLVFNLPSGSDAILQDTGTATDNVVLLHSVTATFEDTTFAVPTNSVTVNSGGGTTAIATSANFSGDFDAGLTINGSTGTNTVTLGPLALSAGSGALSVTAQTININGGTISTASGISSQSFSGPVTLGADTTLTSTGNGTIGFNQTLDGAFALTANTGGGTNFFGAVGGTTALTSISTDAPGLTRIAANAITTGAQTYGDQLALF
ncbi:MAG: hypothetical protein ACXV7D_11865, partial [Thermoanaerobaculia bacterium]